MKKYLILTCILVSCGLTGKKTDEKIKNTVKSEIYEDNTTKPYQLRDSINFTDFEVTINWYNDNIYSSTDSLFRKRYSNIDRVIKFGLTKEEKELIFKTAREIDFFSLPEKLEMRNDISICPSFSTEISIKIRTRNHKVFDESGFIKDKSIQTRFKKIESVISQIIFGKKEVKELPESDMVYL